MNEGKMADYSRDDWDPIVEAVKESQRRIPFGKDQEAMSGVRGNAVALLNTAYVNLIWPTDQTQEELVANLVLHEAVLDCRLTVMGRRQVINLYSTDDMTAKHVAMLRQHKVGLLADILEEGIWLRSEPVPLQADRYIVDILSFNKKGKALLALGL